MPKLGYGCLLNVSFSLPFWFLVRVFGHDAMVGKLAFWQCSGSGLAAWLGFSGG